MGSAIGRNDPCPCGSGKKYKRCHLGAEDDPARPERPPTTEEVAHQAGERAPLPPWTRAIPWVLGGAGLLGAVALYPGGGAQGAGAVLGGGLLLALLWVLLSQPPPPRGDGADPAGLNFGRKDPPRR